MILFFYFLKKKKSNIFEDQLYRKDRSTCKLNIGFVIYFFFHDVTQYMGELLII